MDDQRDYSLTCSVDSDLPGRAIEPNDEIVDAGSHRAQLGYTISLAGGSFESVSRRQTSTAVDVAAAEMFAASTAGAVLIHLTGVLFFVSFGVLGAEPVRMWCDNSASRLAFAYIGWLSPVARGGACVCVCVVFANGVRAVSAGGGDTASA